MTDQNEETEKPQFRTLREISPSAQQLVSSTSDHSRPPTCQIDIATRRAWILLACFRKGDAENPEIYAGAVASVLSSYPEAVAYRVTDPRTGLAGTSKWLPTVSEVRSACEAEMAPAREEEARRLRRERAAAVLGGSDRRIDKANWDRLQAMYGSDNDENPGQSAEGIASRPATPLKLSQEALDSFHRKTGTDQ